jgi:glycosyltransferase involved in cell wall biosynthesis
MNSPRILFVVNVDWFFLSHRLAIARAVRDRGAEVWVASASTGQEEQIIREGFRYLSIPFRRSGKNVFHEFRTIMKIAKNLHDVKPDLVHNVTIKPVLYSSWLSRYVGRPAIVNNISGLGYVFLAPGAKARFLRSVVRMAYRVALTGDRVRVLFENPDDIESFVAKGIVEKRQTVLIRGTGVDVDVFRPFPEQPGVPVVMFASRMLKDKGAVELVDAARLLRDWKVSVRMVFVGEPDPDNPATVTESELREWVDEGVVEWWGHKTEMERILPLAAIVVLPSYREGLPKVLQEAASAGRPIVATDVPGCREVVRDGWNGYLVPPRDHARLATAIRRLVEAPALRARMGKNSREMAIKEFRIEKVSADTLAVYNELLGEKFPGVFAHQPR